MVNCLLSFFDVFLLIFHYHLVGIYSKHDVSTLKSLLLVHVKMENELCRFFERLAKKYHLDNCFLEDF